ncbi:hypothetical protein C8Q80DRAFT_719586 [Daedaleopsis nitida]|nr:hypothetical protein C8Q80DRAFT_719586 [Daedaleopsis nitida]
MSSCSCIWRHSFRSSLIHSPSTSLRRSNMQSSFSSSTNIRPVTIRQLLDATRPHSDAMFSINDIVVDHVSIVAHVIDVRQYDSCLLYHLEDGTSAGRIIARQWRSDMVEQLPDNDKQLYVHVVGQLDTKAAKNTRNSLNIRRIHRVTDIANQLLFHIAETAFVTLCYERGPPPADARRSAVPRQITAFNSPPATPTRPTRYSYSESIPNSPITPVTSSYRSHRTSVHTTPPPTPPPQSALATPRTPVSPVRKPMQTTALQSPVPVTPIRRSLLNSPDPAPTPITPEQSLRQASSPQSPSNVTASPTQRVIGSRRRSGIKRDPYEHLSVLQRAILLQIRNSSAQEGADSLSIIRGVSHHNATARQIGDALDHLKEEGLIENTVDSTHYVVKTSRYPRSP